MNRAFVLLSALLPLLCGISAATESMVQQANAWTPGKPVPAELLGYRRSGFGASYTPGADDTSSVIGAVTNTPLLMEMLFNPKIDDRVFSQVVSRSIHMSGPKAFLNDVYRRYQQHAEALLFPMHKRLFVELNQRHALVDAIFINEADMPATNGLQTMQ